MTTTFRGLESLGIKHESSWLVLYVRAVDEWKRELGVIPVKAAEVAPGTKLPEAIRVTTSDFVWLDSTAGDILAGCEVRFYFGYEEARIQASFPVFGGLGWAEWEAVHEVLGDYECRKDDPDYDDEGEGPPKLDGRALTMARLSGTVNDGGLLTIRGMYAIANERRRRERQDRASAPVDRLGLAGGLEGFLRKQADHRGNDVVSLVRDVLYQWAESRGYRPKDEEGTSES